MRIIRNPKLQMEESSGNNRRRHGRLRCEQTKCGIGQVLDLSASGMRVLRKGKPNLEVGNQLQISIQADKDAPAITLPSQVVWIERQGFRKHMVGFQFIDLDDITKQKLVELARLACDQLIMRCA